MLAATATRRLPFAACRSRAFLASQSLVNSFIGGGTENARIATGTPFRQMSDLPYHLVVGMPALSPTMEAGTISAWNVAEGDTFGAGDSLAEIETDKATIAFEAQDDGVVAKLLVDAGGEEIKVGVPIMVTVEEEDDVAAFKDFVAPEAEAAPDTATAEAPAPPAPAVVEAPPPTPAPTPAPPVEAVPPLAPTAVEEVSAPASVVAAAAAPTVGPSWGNLARVASPIAKTLSAEQKKYIEKYGSTGQIPL